MPFVEVKVFKDELSREQSQELIAKITDAVSEPSSYTISASASGLTFYAVVIRIETGSKNMTRRSEEASFCSRQA